MKKLSGFYIVMLVMSVCVLAIDIAIIYYWPKAEKPPRAVDWAFFAGANAAWWLLAYFKGIKGK